MGDSCGAIKMAPLELKSNSGVPRRRRTRRIWLCDPTIPLVSLLSLLLMTAEASDDGTPVVQSEIGPDGYKICQTVEIRNKVSNFEFLRNCSVIEGNLVIAVIHYRNVQKPNEPDMLNYSFPELREISGYLVVFRSHMDNLTRLFPNLAVIRGLQLFQQYSFVIYENPLMTTLGLKSLTHIMRGGVRIEKNPRLCHVDSVDWSLITQDPKAPPIFQMYNQDPIICPRCNSSCPADRTGRRHLCWNYETCQKVCFCSSPNGTCTDDLKTCCERECIGGCSSPNGTQSCFACRTYNFNGKCIDSCPQNTYVLNGRRCVSEQTCKQFTTKEGTLTRHKPFRDTGQCLHTCPAGYLEDKYDPTECRKCEGRCPLVCPGRKVIKTMSDAEALKGCTIVNGSLSIEINSGGPISTELEEYLGGIEEITDYLKVSRTPALVSFSFLKNLSIIHGRVLQQNYSVLVHDNANLQEFWNWDTKKLAIKAGNFNFQHNQKLCYSKIEELKNRSGLVELELKDQDVSRVTNGDRMACNVVKVTMKITNVYTSAVDLQWDTEVETHFADHRHLHTYTIFFMKATDGRNVTLFDGRDACGSDEWATREVDVPSTRPVEQQKTPSKYHLDELEPFTRYAMYLKTEMLSGSRSTALSDILYFTTKMGAPDAPRNVYVDSKSPNAMDIRWDPPDKPKGSVEWYLVVGVVQTDSDVYMTQRDFCTNDLYTPLPTVSPKIAKSNTTTGSTDCSKCKCDAAAPKGLSRQQKEEAMIFEDLLHDRIFRKRNPNVRTKKSKRNIQSSAPEDRGTTLASFAERSFSELGSGPMEDSERLVDDYGSIPIVWKQCPADRKLETSDNKLQLFCHWVRKDRVTIEGLKHFTNYLIEVHACQDTSETDGRMETKLNCHFESKRKEDAAMRDMCCSLGKQTHQRTLNLRGADDIDVATLRVEQTSSSSGRVSSSSTVNLTASEAAAAAAAAPTVADGGVLVTWDPPPNPNAFIVSYTLEYTRDVDGAKPITICINYKEYNAIRGRVLHGLGTGNYSFRVRASSLSGSGNWTRHKSFYVSDVSDGQRYVTLFISITVIFILVLAVVVFGFYSYFRKKMNQDIPDSVLYASINPEYMTTAYEPDEWEVPRDKIELLQDLGQGSFGMVYRGVVYDLNNVPCTDCAVKTVNEGAEIHERNEFLQEASTMKRFNSYHVVKLLGVVSKGQPVYVIMELMSNGDLKSYLRSHRPDQDETPKGAPPTLRQVLQMAAEIADGMAYLASLKYVHRDLAARNCMVAEDLTVKIGDFGMTRDIYETDYYRKGGKGLLPVRWMSPESLKDGVFTAQGDVWSYGVVLWEMVTLATMPYQGLSNEQVLKWVISRHIMERPENCPDKLYEIMKQCWKYNPKMRPKFTDIVEMLLDDTHEHFRQYSFYTTSGRGALRKEEPLDERPGTSGEGTPLVVQPLHKGGGLASLRENARLGAGDPAGGDMTGDLDEESNLYISDDVITDGDGEESGADNSDSSDHQRRRKSPPNSSLPKHNNSDYGSETSPTVPLLTHDRLPGPVDAPLLLPPNPPVIATGFTSFPSLATRPTQLAPSFTGSDANIPNTGISSPSKGNNAGGGGGGGAKVLPSNQNGAISAAANGRVYIPLHSSNNRTTAC